MQNPQCFCGFGFIDSAHREADVNEHPFADTRFNRIVVIDDAGDVHLPFNAAHVDCGKPLVCVVDLYDAAWNTETHEVLPSFVLFFAAVMSWAAAITA
ncbi:protein of unknown function [Hyphomicrobium sp. MC1]|nr:protein of unknown function [Hyphomicrobium sp. MC1]